jgi:citrate lyase beta subunit
MRYFTKIDDLKFFKDPQPFSKNTDKNVLKYAIGANMYMPATQKNIFEKLINNQFNDIGAITLCMEDAIEESQLPEAEVSAIHLLDCLHDKIIKDSNLNLPLIFIRVRNVKQFKAFSKMLNKNRLEVLTGFNFPKFNSSNGREYFTTLKLLSEKYDEILYGMPIIEDEDVMFKESRFYELEKIQKILIDYQDYVLNIRVGGTDFSSIYGLRRNVNTTIYDIKVVADCLKDILNFFLRQECGYVVSGPVWEYFSWNPESPEIKGLEKELELDIQNGFQGKTIIHPSQINVVNKKYIVRYDEYIDATNIINSDGGVFKSYQGNRMNETNPHRNWAKKILAKAEVFGVYDKDVTLN